MELFATILMSVWNQMEAVTRMQCVQIHLALERAHAKWDTQGMEYLVQISMNV